MGKSMASGTKQSVCISVVDAPEAGLHLYSVQVYVQSGRAEQRDHVMLLDADVRQLALIRLPDLMATGPGMCAYPGTVDQDSWADVPGMKTSITSFRPSDKVMVNFFCSFTPAQVAMNYEIAFTIFRTAKDGGAVNLGNDGAGLIVVSSTSSACSEYPNMMLVDTPPAPGTYTYILSARCKKQDRLVCSEHRLGPDGWISAVIL